MFLFHRWKELLDTIKGSTQKIFFVLNKIDYLNPKEIEEIAAFNKHVLEEMGFAVNEIWPISAREALKAKTNNNDVQLFAEWSFEFRRCVRSFSFFGKREDCPEHGNI